MEDCEVYACDSYGICAIGNGAEGTVRRCSVTNSKGNGLTGRNGAALHVQDCDIFGCGNSAIDVSGKGTQVIARRNFIHHNERGFNASNEVKGTVDENLSEDNNLFQIKIDDSCTLALHDSLVSSSQIPDTAYKAIIANDMTRVRSICSNSSGPELVRVTEKVGHLAMFCLQMNELM